MKLTKILGLCAAVALMLCSCSSKNVALEQMIPADAIGVISINVPEILDKSTILQDGKLKLPESLSAIIDENDTSPLGMLVRDFPVSGISTDTKAYLFFTNKTFLGVAVASLSDAGKTKEVITRRTAEVFKTHKNGIDYIYHNGILYAIKDKVLLMGRTHKKADEEMAISAAVRYVAKPAKNALSDDLIKKTIDADEAINAYMQQQGVKLLLKQSTAYRDIAQKFPLVEIFTESDIQAITCHIALNDDSAELKADIIAPDNSQYDQLLATTLSEADNSFLKAIPGSMSYIGMMSVKGENFVQLPQIQQLTTLFSQLPYIGRINLNEILSTIDGPIAIAAAQDPHLEGEWNGVIAARTTNPNLILRQISTFATMMGQAPEIYDGEYVYQYDNKMIKLGVIDKILYVKMLDYEQTEGYAFENESLKSLFSNCPIGFFAATEHGNFDLVFPNVRKIAGTFSPKADGTPATLALLQALCSIKPAGDFENYEDDEALMVAPSGTAIDALRPVE
ncbi:MAG: DUF4836 family protein [Muribaculaceae bacterium]|nr:DUF4836 family protein [Muribaculaceae bacterium]